MAHKVDITSIAHLSGLRLAPCRKKDAVRSKVAYNRKRVKGLFVSKHLEMRLGSNDLDDEPDTDDPD